MSQTAPFAAGHSFSDRLLAILLLVMALVLVSCTPKFDAGEGVSGVTITPKEPCRMASPPPG